ncbi:hypothetical protein VDBG_08039, partial [Verticillium alfalfae VaMs.102]
LNRRSVSSARHVLLIEPRHAIQQSEAEGDRTALDHPSGLAT